MINKNQVLRIPRSSLVVRHRHFLHKLFQAAKYKTPTELAKIIQSANSNQIKALSELSQNLLKATYPKTTKAYLRKMKPFKDVIRKLGSVRSSVKAKQRTLLQQNLQHGGLPFLVPLLAPIIGSLLSAGISATI